MRKGELVPGRVVTLDDQGVTFAPDSGGELRVPWTEVIPLNRYELWESTLAADDATSRVALAKWCLETGLFTYARREFLKARGLGYAGSEPLDTLLVDVDRAEADATLGHVDELVLAGQLEKALERVKSHLRAAPPGEHADRVRARVPDLLARIEQRDALSREQEEDRKKAEKTGRLKEWIERNLAAAAKRKAEGGDAAIEGFANLARGNQTRARASLAAAEAGYQAARDIYRRVRKAVQPGEVADTCARESEACDQRTVEVLARWGALEVQNKAWRRASPVVDRGLRIDPVNRELLELRREIDDNWIRRKLSDITNAEGRESGQ